MYAKIAPEKEAEIRRLLEQDFPLQVICEHTGVSYPTVHKRRKAMLREKAVAADVCDMPEQPETRESLLKRHREISLQLEYAEEQDAPAIQSRLDEVSRKLGALNASRMATDTKTTRPIVPTIPNILPPTGEDLDEEDDGEDEKPAPPAPAPKRGISLGDLDKIRDEARREYDERVIAAKSEYDTTVEAIKRVARLLKNS